MKVDFRMKAPVHTVTQKSVNVVWVNSTGGGKRTNKRHWRITQWIIIYRFFVFFQRQFGRFLCLDNARFVA